MPAKQSFCWTPSGELRTRFAGSGSAKCRLSASVLCMVNHTTFGQAGSTGLVLSHKSDREPAFQPLGIAEVSVYADLVKVKVPHSSSPTRPRGDRKPITGFSARSRKNMLENLARLRNPTGGIFVTLTYPGKFDYQPDQVKTHLSRFRKALERQYPGCGVFWRMELKERLSGASEGQKVPHFHLLIFLYQAAVPLVDFRVWLAPAWWRSVGSNDPDHLQAGTQADLIFNRKHAQRYASKYAAKEDELLENCQDLTVQSWGRRWGKFGDLDLGAAFTVTIALNKIHDLRRMAAKLLRSKGRNYAKRLKRQSASVGFAVFGLGDLSFEGWENFTDSTILRMMLAL